MIFGTKMDGFGRLRIAIFGLLAVIGSLVLFNDYARGLPMVEQLRDAACSERVLEGVRERKAKRLGNFLPQEVQCMERLEEVNNMVAQKQGQTARAFFLGAFALSILWLLTGLLGWIFRGFQNDINKPLLDDDD